MAETFDLSGRSRMISDLCAALRPLSVESRIVCLAGEATFPEAEAPVGCLGRRGGMDWRVVFRLVHELRAGQADLVHSHGRGAFLYAGLATFFRPHLRHVHTVHRADGDPLGAPEWIRRRIARRVAAVAAVSKAARTAFLNRSGVPPSRVSVIPNGIDLSRFDFRTRTPQHPGATPVLGTLSQLTADKDQATVLRAFVLIRRRYPAARLQLVGDGPDAPRLRVLAQELGIAGDVEFLGLRADVPHVLAGFDVLIHAARTEGLGLAVLEAMACGVPVVATAVGGLPEIVLPGRTGWLVPAGDPVALSHAVAEVLAHPQHVEGIRREAARLVWEQFSRERMAADYRYLYDGVLSTGVSGQARCPDPPPPTALRGSGPERDAEVSRG